MGLVAIVCAVSAVPRPCAAHLEVCVQHVGTWPQRHLVPSSWRRASISKGRVCA